MTTRSVNWVLQWGGSCPGSRVQTLTGVVSGTWRLDFHVPPRPAGSQTLHLVKSELWFLTWRGRRFSRISTVRAKWATHGLTRVGPTPGRWATWGGLLPAGGWGLTRDPAGEVCRPRAEFDYTRGGYPLRGTFAPSFSQEKVWSPWGGEDFLVRPRYV